MGAVLVGISNWEVITDDVGRTSSKHEVVVPFRPCLVFVEFRKPKPNGSLDAARGLEGDRCKMGVKAEINGEREWNGWVR